MLGAADIAAQFGGSYLAIAGSLFSAPLVLGVVLEAVVLLAAEKSLAIAVRRADAGARFTTLRERLREAAGRFPELRSLPSAAEP